MAMTSFKGRGVGFGFGIGCSFGIGWGFGGAPIQTWGFGVGGGCGVGIGLSGAAYGTEYFDTKYNFDSKMRIYPQDKVAQTVDRLGKRYPQLNRPGATEIIRITTQGDRDGASRESIGLFTKEIDEALLAGEIDIAVHSMKDVPTSLPCGMLLPCNLEREDFRDAVIMRCSEIPCLAEMPAGSKIGTSSPRRKAQILKNHPHLQVDDVAGNVQTRLQKLQQGRFDALVLAFAGLKRLWLEQIITQLLPIDEMLPAVGQGAVGIACREGNTKMQELLHSVNHEETKLAVDCERAFLKTLGGSCRTPIAGLAWKNEQGGCNFRGLLASEDDDTTVLEVSRQGLYKQDEMLALGIDAAKDLQERMDRQALLFHS